MIEDYLSELDSGDYVDQGTEEKVKSVPEPCNCWKVFALLLLLIAGKPRRDYFYYLW